MDKLYEYTKSAVVNFKLDRCCCLAPIRTGVIIIGYFNVFIALLSLVGTADGGITPPLMAVQELVLEDNASKPLGVLAYAAELGFNMVLLCGMYRKDIALLRIYTYFVMVAVVTSILVYSMVIALISLLTKLLIFLNMVFQGYIILLVRSAIVEIKETKRFEKNGHAVLYSVTKNDEHRVEIKIPDVEDKGSTDIEKIQEDIIKVEQNDDKIEKNDDHAENDDVNVNVKSESVDSTTVTSKEK